MKIKRSFGLCIDTCQSLNGVHVDAAEGKQPFRCSLRVMLAHLFHAERDVDFIRRKQF